MTSALQSPRLIQMIQGAWPRCAAIFRDVSKAAGAAAGANHPPPFARAPTTTKTTMARENRETSVKWILLGIL